MILLYWWYTVLLFIILATHKWFYPSVGHSASIFLFKPPPPVGAGGGYMFSGCPSVRDSRGSIMFPRYLQYLLADFRQTFVTGASRDKDELIAFWGQKVKCQGHSKTKCAREFCFRNMSSIYRWIFAKLLSLVHLGTQMTWLRFWIKRSKFKVTPSRRRRTALDATVECNFF